MELTQDNLDQIGAAVSRSMKESVEEQIGVPLKMHVDHHNQYERDLIERDFARKSKRRIRENVMSWAIAGAIGVIATAMVFYFQSGAG